MFLRSCWLLQNCFNKNNINIHCLITSGSSLLPEFCMDPACLTWQLTQVSHFLLLPKIAHPVTFPVMCELCKKENKDSVSKLLNQQLFKLSVQDICTFFHLEPVFTASEPWCTVYLLQRKCYDCHELWKLFSTPANAKVFLSCWKRITNWQGKICIVLTATFNCITFLTVISEWLQLLWLWLFQPPKHVFTISSLTVMVRTIFPVYFLYHAVSLSGIMSKEYAERILSTLMCHRFSLKNSSIKDCVFIQVNHNAFVKCLQKWTIRIS